MSDSTFLAINSKTLQPACVLIQAALGGDTQFLKRHFDAKHWTTSPEDLVPVKVNAESAAKLCKYLDETESEWKR